MKTSDVTPEMIQAVLTKLKQDQPCGSTNLDHHENSVVKCAHRGPDKHVHAGQNSRGKEQRWTA